MGKNAFKFLLTITGLLGMSTYIDVAYDDKMEKFNRVVNKFKSIASKNKNNK